MRHHREMLGQVALHWVEEGQGEPVLLLHGFPDFWYGWRAQLPALAAAGFRAVAPDLRGYGESDRPRGVPAYGVSRLVEDVAALIDRVGGSAHVAGHDWGGVIAWHLAARHPDRVRRLLVLNAPHPAAFARELRHPRQLLRSWYALFFQLPAIPEAVLRAGRFRALRGIIDRPAHHMTRDDVERYVDMYAQPGMLTAALNYYRASGRALPRRSRGEGSSRVAVRTRVIWGEEDVALNIRLLDGLERYVRELEIVRLPRTGHFVHWEQPERVNELMLEFLRQP